MTTEITTTTDSTTKPYAKLLNRRLGDLTRDEICQGLGCSIETVELGQTIGGILVGFQGSSWDTVATVKVYEPTRGGTVIWPTSWKNARFVEKLSDELTP